MSPKPFHEDDTSAATVHQQRYDETAPGTFVFALTAVAGPDEGLSFVIDAEGNSRVLAGQGPACELRLSDPAVSRRHVAFETDGAVLRVTDLESTNGTWLNGVRVTEAQVRGGEQVQLGSDIFAVERRDVGAVPRHGQPRPAEESLGGFGGVLGVSREMRRLYPLCARLAASAIPVVIEGETGTGKEALAEAIHAESPRANGPFVVFDCTAVPASMMEAELFGHERGAFTGAVQRQLGVLEQAHGGTLLIDEIGDLDVTLQPKLLRAIERGEFRRIGGQQAIRVDVRILAATRRNLDRAVELGRFRDDLFHRLAVGRIELPPLRQRRGDIGVLAAAFADQLGGKQAEIPPHLLTKWEDQPWPGNVRELRNAVARYLALGEQLAAEVANTQAAPVGTTPGTAVPESGGDIAQVAEEVIAEGMPLVRARQHVVDAFERQYLAAMLARHGGVVTHAAAAAGIARRHFQRLRARPR